MTTPRGCLFSNNFVSATCISLKDLIFPINEKPSFTGKHFSLNSDIHSEIISKTLLQLRLGLPSWLCWGRGQGSGWGEHRTGKHEHTKNSR